MGIINSIKLQGCPVFSGVDSSLEDCAIVNFIYGSNGSGKSTISNYLQNPQLPLYSACSIEWTGDSSEILVYNKEWRETNFRSCSDLPGVFTLGSDSLEARENIQKLQRDIDSSNEKIQTAQSQKEAKKKELADEISEFQDAAWKVILKPNEEVFAPALSGFRNSKTKFAERLLDKPNILLNQTREELVNRVRAVFSGEPVELEEINSEEISSIILRLKTVERETIWGKVIAGNKNISISGLIEELNNSDWVNQGRGYIVESDTCPFCQKKTIDADFKKQLEMYFDAQYEEDISTVNTLIHEYEQSSSLLIQRLTLIASNDKYSAARIDGLGNFHEVLTKIEQSTNTILNQMKLKIEEPSRMIELEKDGYLNNVQDVISTLNESIRKHNEMVANLNEERRAVSRAVWELLYSENITMIKAHNKKVRDANLAINGLSQTIQRQETMTEQLLDEIVEARKKITSIQPTIDEINRSLHAYGFDGFSIQASEGGDNCYQIVRPDGALVNKTLSEGEETFIAFLYFMQLVRGTTNPNDFSPGKVLVIDDPICSLDSTILYIVSCLVKSLIYEAKNESGGVRQIFILTHNAFFHKEASYNRGQSFCDNETKYWMIRKYGSQSKIKCYEQDNPIKTSYELLWDEVKDESATVISLQNAMRRIIENYFGMLGSHKADAIEDQFESLEERMICKSLFAWMNDGSHSIPDDLYIDSYSESPDKYREVFRTVFEKTNNEEHYKMMMGESALASMFGSNME